jgi:hypothetical protein
MNGSATADAHVSPTKQAAPRPAGAEAQAASYPQFPPGTTFQLVPRGWDNSGDVKGKATSDEKEHKGKKSDKQGDKKGKKAHGHAKKIASVVKSDKGKKFNSKTIVEGWMDEWEPDSGES